MRVAYICTDPGVPVFGKKGCSVHVQAILREMLAAGYDVSLLARRLGGPVPRDLRDVQVTMLERVKTKDAAERERGLAAGNRPLRLRLERLPRFDVVYERYSLWSCAGMQFAADHGIPAILEINAPLLREQAAHRELVDADRARQLSVAAFSNADLMLAVSEGVADQITADFGLVHPPRLHVIANGVQPSQFEAAREQVWSRLQAERTKDAPTEFVVGFVGTLRSWHGLSTLGAAFSRLHAKLPEARLLIVGDGNARWELLRTLSPSARMATTITGAVAHADVPALLGQMDVAVAPYANAGTSSDPDIDTDPDTKNFYFSPLKVMEYLAAGLPVVCSTADSFGSLVHDGNAAFFKAGDPEALADCLRQLHRDRDLRRGLAEAAYHSITDEHTWKCVLRKTMALAGVYGPADMPARSVG